MFRLLLVLKVLSNLLIFQASAARILFVIPTPSFSHNIVYRSLTEALAERGHHVVVVTTHPFPPGESPPNVTEIDMYDISLPIWQEAVSKILHEKGEIRIARLYIQMFMDIFEKQIHSKPMQDLINRGRDHFDVLLIENTVEVALGLLNVFDAPAIHTSTLGPMPITYSVFGAPTQPLLYTTCINVRSYNLTMWEAIQMIYKFVVHFCAIASYESEEVELFERNLGLDKSNILPTSKLYERVNVILQTVYPIWMNNPPVPPGIVYAGGMHQKKPKQLPQELQRILDASEKGVIYVSFGSNIQASNLNKKNIDMMARVFSKLPYDVLWKRDQFVHTDAAKNIHVSKWFPQADLLYHENIKVFITQGGLQSTEEAITAGVPLIGIPMYADQWMNTENYVNLGIGLKLDWITLTEEEFAESIEKVIGDNSFKRNVVRLSSVMGDQPLPPAERAVWWTEYVVRHRGARHLRPAAADLCWPRYFELQLIAELLLALALALSAAAYLVRRLARFLTTRNVYKHRSKMI